MFLYAIVSASAVPSNPTFTASFCLLLPAGNAKETVSLFLGLLMDEKLSLHRKETAKERATASRDEEFLNPGVCSNMKRSSVRVCESAA